MKEVPASEVVNGTVGSKEAYEVEVEQMGSEYSQTTPRGLLWSVQHVLYTESILSRISRPAEHNLVRRRSRS